MSIPRNLSFLAEGASATGVLGVTNGGTGATTLTSGYLVKGNGTSAVSASVVYDTGTNVGIGTASPATLLDVNGTAHILTSLAVGADATSFTPSGLNAIPNYGVGYITTGAITTLTSFGAITAYTAQTERFRITQAGNVGIGTNAPTNTLDVTGTARVTSTLTLPGTSSTIAALLTNIAEPATISATAATGTIAFYPSTQSVLYYTSNASGNWTLNITFSAGTTMNTAMTTGQSMTVAFMVTTGTTAYYNNVVQVDGSTVTPKWQGGTAPTAGNVSSVDVYTYTIIKTGNAAFTVFASQTQFK